MSEMPDRDRIAADEQRIGELLRAVEAPAPPALQASVAQRYFRRRGLRARRAPLIGFATALAGAAVALALVLSSSAGVPTVLQVTKLALARPTASAPPTLVATGTTISFPDWSRRGWPNAGVRTDRLGGRAVTTEFYRSYEAGTLGYAIVSGAPLRWGASGSSVASAGERYTLIGTGGAQIVTWVQDGHTCILASRTASSGALLRLAISQETAASA